MFTNVDMINYNDSRMQSPHHPPSVESPHHPPSVESPHHPPSVESPHHPPSVESDALNKDVFTPTPLYRPTHVLNVHVHNKYGIQITNLCLPSISAMAFLLCIRPRDMNLPLKCLYRTKLVFAQNVLRGRMSSKCRAPFDGVLNVGRRLMAY